jgi:hypothetical protein
MARAVRYQGLGTFEFLVDAASTGLPFVFIEANPRLQVEHTVTEEVFGVDLVQAQIRLAAGERLRAIGLDPPRRRARGLCHPVAHQRRDAGRARARHARQRPLARFDVPAGPGIRVDTHGVAGRAPSPHYDTLLAKLVVHARGGFADALRRSRRALAEFRIEGLATNLPLLRRWPRGPRWPASSAHALAGGGAARAAGCFQINSWSRKIDRGYRPKSFKTATDAPAHAIVAPMPARLVQLSVAEGDEVPAGAELAVLEAMKMEHVLAAPHAGRVPGCSRCPAATWARASHCWCSSPSQARPTCAPTMPPRTTRPHPRRPAARAGPPRLHAGRRPPRGHGQAPRPGQPQRAREHGRSVRRGQLHRIRRAGDCRADAPPQHGRPGRQHPGRRHGHRHRRRQRRQFGPRRARAVVMAYDATVLAGTQGMRNHAKTDRMLGIALEQLPVVLFAEGGGGRPGDTDMPSSPACTCHLRRLRALSGQVPVVGIVHGRCFAGNAALLGCSDVIIATRASNIGMGGPAMIEAAAWACSRPRTSGPARCSTATA